MRKYTYLLSLLVLLVLTIFLAENSRAADPNDFRKPNNWQRERTINDTINKSSVKVEAQKTYPVSTLDQNGKPIKQIRNAKATIKLTPPANAVGKSLMKRVPAIAITQAIISLLGKSVDWVMDPANNRVTYTDTDVTESGQYQSNVDKKIYSSMSQICSLINAVRGTSYPCRLQNIDPSTGAGTVFLYNPDDAKFNVAIAGFYIPIDLPAIERSIPIYQIAEKITNQAEEGQAPAMEVMADTALDMLEQGLLDSQLDAASNVPQPDSQEITQGQYDNPDYPVNGTGSGTGPETPTNPETPTDPETPNPDAKPFELPPFCSWASKVCDFIDWVKTEPSEPSESGDIALEKPDPVIHEDLLERLYINMPAQCPPDPVLEFMGARIPFPMSVFCTFAVMMKPLILLFAYIKGLAIIGNGLS